jgi:uncharacterized cofD-like protein
MGGSTKVIRDHYEVGPVGDIRIVIESLMPESERESREIMGMRIQSQNGAGFMDGHPCGNINLLMAIKYFDGDVVKAIRHVMREKRVWHTVLPVTAAKDAHLVAWLDNGDLIEREGVIDDRLKDNPDDTRKIIEAFLRPMPSILPEAREAIRKADTIVVCAGSTFTSIGACFCVYGLASAIRENLKAKFVQIVNLMTNANESPDWTASQHVDNVYRVVLRTFDYIICNDPHLISPDVASIYQRENASPVAVDMDKLSRYVNNIDNIIVGKLADEEKSPIRHNAKLAKLIASF